MCTSPIPLLVSTRNRHKLREIRTILGARFEVSDLSILPTMHEVEETGTSFEENADLKAVAASQLFEGWVIADDSGLEVDALGGSPGVYSARYAGETASDSENNALLLKNLKEVPEKKRRARFRCVIVLARAGRKLARRVFRDVCRASRRDQESLKPSRAGPQPTACVGRLVLILPAR